MTDRTPDLLAAIADDETLTDEEAATAFRAASELCSPMHRLHLAGVLAAAGFDGGQEGTAAGENAGCDRCGTNDRPPGSRYCEACIDDGYRVFVNGRPETEYLHDTAADARDEAFLVAEQTQDGVADVHGPGDYRERVELAEHTGGTR